MMASLLVVFLLFLTHFASVEAKNNSSKLISIGSSLSTFSPNNSWLSPSGFFAFGFYPQSNGFAVGIWLVGQPNNTIVWTANRDHPPVSANSTIEFTTNGRLILRTDQRTEVMVTDEPAMFASMLDSGNFVLYVNDSYAIWQSFDYPTDTILAGQTLSPSGGDTLVSSVLSSSDHASGRFLLKMQNDGKLAAYPVNCSDSLDAYWATDTSGDVELNLNFTGILFLSLRLSEYSSYSRPKKVPYNSSVVLILANSSSSLAENNNTFYRATLDDDGIFRLYSHSFLSNTKRSNVSIKWSALKDHCQVHTFCGFNSYCSSNGTSTSEATCHCFPGFVFVDPSKKFLGCFRNFSEDICRDEKGLLNISTLHNLRWGDHSYSVISMNKKEDCGKSCLEDCNCGGALYFSGLCRKHKLPLRYGTINSSDSVTAFVKVILGTAKIPDLPGGNFSPTSTVVTENRRNLIIILAISLGSITCLCFVIAISSFFLYRHRVHTYKKLSDSTAKMGLTEEFTLRSFSYSELEKATQGFKEELGKGSVGTVYKGTLTSARGNKIVAVKRLENVLEEGEREFQSEVTAIGRTHHKNLVRLLGYCVEGPRKLLVYEYMSNGSLADVLFNAERCYPSWKERVNIALDIARGILYLHEECEACIIHCGIKPQNILMDDSWTAKISDFGFAKLLLMPNHIRRSITTGVRGTKSYFAPEWQKDALISVKADIYSFGIVLLEIICCRSNIEVNVSNPDEILLSTWVYECFVAGELQRLVGDEKVQVNTLQRMVKVGLWCIQDDPSLRPSMKNVILMLEGTVDIPVPPHPSPSLKHS